MNSIRDNAIEEAEKVKKDKKISIEIDRKNKINTVIVRNTAQPIEERDMKKLTKKRDLTGIYSHEFKYDKTTYKIAYDIYEEEKVVVLLTGTHENFYEQLKRYLK